MSFVPLLSLSPILGLETGGKGLKPVQSISGMNLITLPSEGGIKNEMMDPGSLKSPSGKGKDSNDLHWGTARAQHPIPDQGPVLVSQTPIKQPPLTHLSLKMHFCYTLITDF